MLLLKVSIETNSLLLMVSPHLSLRGLVVDRGRISLLTTIHDEEGVEGTGGNDLSRGNAQHASIIFLQS